MDREEEVQARDSLRKWLRRVGLITYGSVLSLIIIIAAGKAQAIPNGGYAHPEILIQPEELKALIDKKDSNLRIIDIREKLKYLAGRIPGAAHVWRPDITDENHPISGMMAPKDQIENLMGSLGISNQDTLVIYSDGSDNARLWWTLAYYGFPLNQMKLLDGGIEAWKRKGYPTDTTPRSLEKTGFKFGREVEARESLLCDLKEVKVALKLLRDI